jgi:hypothetical protein
MFTLSGISIRKNRFIVKVNEKKRLKIIACGTVIEEMLPFFSSEIEYKEVEPGLHLNSERLRNALQDLINDTSSKFGNIILGFGLCSMGVVGLKSRESNLIVPRVDDCVGIFLGSQASYEHQLKKERGTYFLSKGWIDAGVTLIEEFRQTEERMGKKVADIVKKRMLRRYTRLAYIDMGHPDQERYRGYSRRAANELGLRYDEVKGTTDLIERMLFGPWDDNFIVAPPGHTISLDDFKKNGSGISPG